MISKFLFGKALLFRILYLSVAGVTPLLNCLAYLSVAGAAPSLLFPPLDPEPVECAALHELEYGLVQQGLERCPGPRGNPVPLAVQQPAHLHTIESRRKSEHKDCRWP